MTDLDEETLKTITTMAVDIKYIIIDNEKFCKKVDEHEKRINKIENRQHTLYGKLVVVVAIVSVIISSFLSWLLFIFSRIIK